MWASRVPWHQKASCTLGCGTGAQPADEMFKELEHLLHEKRLREWGLFSLSEFRRGFGDTQQQPYITCKKVTKHMTPGSSQRYTVKRRETTDVAWNKMGSDCTQGTTFLPVGQSNHGAGCPDRLCSLQPWRFPRLDQAKSPEQPVPTSTATLTMLAAGGWTRWLPEVLSDLHHPLMTLSIQKKKKTLTLSTS